jgi:aminodeoxyfutalosine synthase
MLTDLEPKAAARAAFTRAEAERVFGCTDLVSVGLLAETARRAHHGERVTYGQVLNVEQGVPATIGDAREVRLTGRPESFAAAVAWVEAVVSAAGTVPVTGFSVAHLVDLAEGDHHALSEGARRLRAAGLAAVASIPIDCVEDPAARVRTLQEGELPVWRAVIEHAPTLDRRLALIERVAALQHETGVLKTFAPLPIVDRADTPSTGYDDVRTIAVARLVCANVPSIQVDWALYGPKLAQVAIAYGADDLDNVSALDTLALGARRSPRQDIERQIVAAFATPAARDAGFEPLS